MVTLGYLLPTCEAVMAGDPGTARLLGLAERAESLGYAGPLADVADYLAGFVAAGASHVCIRLCGDHERNLDALAGTGAALGDIR